MSTRPAPHTPLVVSEPVVRESPPSPPDSSPSLRALEISRAPSVPQQSEPSEDAESADDFGAERTPAGILVDRAAIERPRSAAQRAQPLASAVVVALLGVALWGQAARMGTAATSEPAAAERAPDAPARLAPKPKPKPEPVRQPERVVPEPAAAHEPAPDVAVSAPTEVAYDARRLDLALRWARTHADRCHRGGRAVGTAQLSITFSPEGKVTAFQLTGEPIASAPVARCVATYFQSMLIPAFDGEAFTIHETLTLR